ncbi:MAG TPA: YlmC/YmxH family sporulation protein [Candidatus Flavonifractor merdigallinarum]|uniref:YlmC/YmxH family sporulation protein n=1 Tax=Candidatus Flavonifractor merdigallinarum TaxID=2838589 RepID=A0A9D1YDD0_9FIRM|nr:YlmC/YmxH family sporulation protein [Candidatus Flavonifractor merdigallinarum]
MGERVTELRCKEIIGLGNGTRYGYVGDVELDLETGQVLALVVPGRLRLLGLLGREPERVFPWAQVRRVGTDIVLVEGPPRLPETQRGRGRHPAHSKQKREDHSKT